jgi:hypothetical protein
LPSATEIGVPQEPEEGNFLNENNYLEANVPGKDSSLGGRSSLLRLSKDTYSQVGLLILH